MEGSWWRYRGVVEKSCGREGLYVRLVDGWLYTHVKYITIHTVHYFSISPLSPALSHLRTFLTVA